MWRRSWSFKCLLHRRGSLQLLQRRCDPITRKGVSHVHRPPNRARCLQHRAQDRRSLWSDRSQLLSGAMPTVPLTCDWKVTNTRHVHPWISKRVLKREKERVRMCVCVYWCVGGMWRRVTYVQLADSSWHLYKKSVVFSWIDRSISIHFYKEPG